MKDDFRFDVVVVGAGHAGCEAARAAALTGASTCLVTMDLEKIAAMSCNPAVGGIAKGQIVREIDALGGMMGEVTDLTALQMRMLNRSKGPAMWSPRAQCDRTAYGAAWRRVLENTPRLSLWQDQVTELTVRDGRTVGVRTQWGVEMRARCVVVTAGTFLNGLMHVGQRTVEGGRIAEPAAKGLTESLVAAGLKKGRMKTGTPMRLDGRTIHFEEMEEQRGERDFHRFSFRGVGGATEQLSCWTTSTNEAVHEVLRRALPLSPLYNGRIRSTGPRYCPSIETKIVTFPDRGRHPLFLEPEGRNTRSMYLNGFSSSMPLEVQLEAVRKISAFREAQIYRPGYAIEYDYFDPTDLEPTLESKRVKGLYMAGQVNGTTGYEEAAGQGLIAGLNAARAARGEDGLVTGRDEAYIGVLIDDLVTKGVDEPYRMFTSRAEYRILLRQDNADTRLTPKGIAAGLVGTEQARRWKAKERAKGELKGLLEGTTVKPAEMNDYLEAMGSAPINEGCKLASLVERPELSIASLCKVVERLGRMVDGMGGLGRGDCSGADEVVEAVEVELKYDGYIARERQLAEKMRRLEGIRIRGCFDYAKIRQLSTEARQKLSKINPETIAQAARIPGVSPSDINVLLVLSHR